MEPVDPLPKALVLLVVRGREVALGPVDASMGCDLALVDQLLQLRLAAGRVGATIRLAQVHRDLQELVDLVGLGDRLGLEPDPRPEAQASRRAGSPNWGNSSG